jgi:hypothetical protein
LAMSKSGKLTPDPVEIQSIGRHAMQMCQGERKSRSS